MPTPRKRNEQLAGLLREAGWSQAAMATAFNRVTAESPQTRRSPIGRTHVSEWVAGSVPHDDTTRQTLIETFSRKLARPVSASDLGFPATDLGTGGLWDGDTLTALTDHGSVQVPIQRRAVLQAAAYQVAALAVPGAAWWAQMALTGRTRPGAGRRVGAGDLAAVEEMTALFSQADQRWGGGHGRTALSAYLSNEVAGYLNGRFPTDDIRRRMFSAAAELAYLSGWMGFDAGNHPYAQERFTTAVKLAAEADNAALAGHILRAMAHQANDLGHHREALRLAQASIAEDRYRTAGAREKALLGVVHARTLASNGDARGAAQALLRAETDLTHAKNGTEDPRRVWFFSEASLAHETACTLRDSGDTEGALTQFATSVRMRNTTTYARTHIVTLGYTGELLARQGNVEQACHTMNRALDLADGVRSERINDTVRRIQSSLSPYRRRGVAAVLEVDQRARHYLATAA